MSDDWDRFVLNMSDEEVVRFIEREYSCNKLMIEIADRFAAALDMKGNKVEDSYEEGYDAGLEANDNYDTDYKDEVRKELTEELEQEIKTKLKDESISKKFPAMVKYFKRKLNTLAATNAALLKQQQEVHEAALEETTSDCKILEKHMRQKAGDMSKEAEKVKQEANVILQQVIYIKASMRVRPRRRMKPKKPAIQIRYL